MARVCLKRSTRQVSHEQVYKLAYSRNDGTGLLKEKYKAGITRTSIQTSVGRKDGAFVWKEVITISLQDVRTRKFTPTLVIKNNRKVGVVGLDMVF